MCKLGKPCISWGLLLKNQNFFCIIDRNCPGMFGKYTADFPNEAYKLCLIVTRESARVITEKIPLLIPAFSQVTL